jgi:hypothetical protein
MTLIPVLRELQKSELNGAAQLLGRGMCDNPLNLRAFGIEDRDLWFAKNRSWGFWDASRDAEVLTPAQELRGGRRDQLTSNGVGIRTSDRRPQNHDPEAKSFHRQTILPIAR